MGAQGSSAQNGGFRPGQYQKVFSGSDMCETLAEPEWGGRLCFAGEACIQDRVQCVDGALVTGRKAADVVAETMRRLNEAEAAASEVSGEPKKRKKASDDEDECEDNAAAKQAKKKAKEAAKKAKAEAEKKTEGEDEDLDESGASPRSGAEGRQKGDGKKMTKWGKEEDEVRPTFSSDACLGDQTTSI